MNSSATLERAIQNVKTSKEAQQDAKLASQEEEKKQSK